MAKFWVILAKGGQGLGKFAIRRGKFAIRTPKIALRTLKFGVGRVKLMVAGLKRVIPRLTRNPLEQEIAGLRFATPGRGSPAQIF
jgi:hypothetical protein